MIECENNYRISNIRGKVISFTGGKGGVGTTTILGEIAYLFFKLGTETACVDFDIHNGSLHMKFDITLTDRIHTVSDLIPLVGELTPRTISNAVSSTTRGVRILPRPESIEQASLLSSSHIEAMIKSFSLTYPLVLIDTPAGANPIAVSTCSVSDITVLITTPEIPSIIGTKRLLDTFSSSKTPFPLLVVNRSFVGKDALTLGEIESFLGMHTSVIIAEDTFNTRRLSEEGRFLSDEKTPVSRGIRALLKELSSLLQIHS
ncbi:MAG: AAA family ATPase [Actinomycetota bacterium]|nr:AAA family ATPase [Actinomycetota bacterium]